MRSCSLLYIARDLELADRLVRTIGRIGGQRRKSRDKSINIYLKCEDSEKNRNGCVLALCFFLEAVAFVDPRPQTSLACCQT
jgi:hypothetical protein